MFTESPSLIRSPHIILYLLVKVKSLSSLLDSVFVIFIWLSSHLVQTLVAWHFIILLQPCNSHHFCWSFGGQISVIHITMVKSEWSSLFASYIGVTPISWFLLRLFDQKNSPSFRFETPKRRRGISQHLRFPKRAAIHNELPAASWKAAPGMANSRGMYMDY